MPGTPQTKDLPMTRKPSAHGLVSMAAVALLSACAPQQVAAPKVGSDAGTPASASNVRDQDPDAELAAFAPAGSRIRLSARGDLDADGDDDALLVLDDGQDATAAMPRVLLLLRRDAAGRLQVGLESPHAILCRRCGGMTGDPLHSIRIGSSDFTLRFEGGSRELWSSEYGFAYARELDQWQLRRVEHAGFDRTDGANASRTLTQEEIGEVTLADFDAASFAADAMS
jgi:hypothetical protein